MAKESSQTKLARLAERVIADIDKNYMTQLMDKDKTLTKLRKQYNDSINTKHFFQAQIIHRQMYVRTEQLQTEEAGRRIHEYCEKGHIDGYLEKEDHDKIEAGNVQVHILLDAIDSVFNDVLAVYSSYDLAPEELFIQRELRLMRTEIEKWFRQCHVTSTEYEEPTRCEGDRVYDYVRQRQAVMFRKFERMQKKKDGSDKKTRS